MTVDLGSRPSAQDALPGPEDSSWRRMISRWDWQSHLLTAVLVVVAIAAALLVAALLLVATGGPPGGAFEAMVSGSIGSTSSLVTTLNHTAPILIVAVGACIAGRAALVNIGQEGQLTIGALLGTAVALRISGPSIVTIPIVLMAAAVGGGLWAGIAAVIRYARGVNEVVSTLLLNFVAFEVVSYAVNQPWLLQESRERSGQILSPQSNPIPQSMHLPTVMSGDGYILHLGIVIAFVAVGVVAVLIAKTGWGFNLRALGFNARAARRAGVSPARLGGTALVLSGAFAGLAGGVMLTGSVFRIQDGFSNNYGWEGLLVALVAGYSPLLAIPVAFLFGALRAGGGVLASAGVSPAIVGVIQALIVLAVVLPSVYVRGRYRATRRAARRAHRADETAAEVSDVV